VVAATTAATAAAVCSETLMPTDRSDVGSVKTGTGSAVERRDIGMLTTLL